MANIRDRKRRPPAAVISGMGGPLWFQDEIALPALKVAVGALEDVGVPEFDRETSQFSPPDDLFPKVPPHAFITGLEPFVGLVIFLGASFGSWAAERLFDASWETVKEAWAILLASRRDEPGAVERPLTLKHGYWLELDGVRIEVRAEIAPGQTGVNVPELMKRALDDAARLQLEPGTTHEVVVAADE